MATTKKTATKKTTTKATTATDNTTALVKRLQTEVSTLREEVTSLKNQLSNITTTTTTTDDSSISALQQKITKALRGMGIREWVLRDSGLK